MGSTKEVQMYIAGVVKRFRLDRKLTQLELSSKLKYQTSQFISNLERGKNSIPSNRLKSFSKVLRCPLELLVDAKCEDFKADVWKATGTRKRV